jgi:hypothetical protein
MRFNNDLFISYAHIDNQPLTEGQEGWIADFHRALEHRLAQLRGERPKIWRDPKLQGNDYFGDEIVQQFPGLALLVSVLSPRYVKSEWCVRELKEFCKAAEQTGGVRVINKSRIFKVVKTPIDHEKHPPEVRDLLGYEFFQFDERGTPLEFDKIFGPDAERNFWIKLNDLAYDIHQLLETLEKSTTGSTIPTVDEGVRNSIPNKPCIYLAETTFDLREKRDNVRRELQQRGYVVLPDQPLPSYSPEFEQVVQENLVQSKLSVHLIGERYGLIPEAAEQSAIELQYELAIAHQQHTPNFTHLIWAPPGLAPQDTRQQNLIETLQKDTEFLQTGLEELKTIIQDKLNPKPKVVPLSNPMNAAPVEDGLKRVYLIYDQPDEEAIAPIYDYLSEQGVEVMLPELDGDEADVRQAHQEFLNICDAVLIYYGNVKEPWIRAKLDDVQKSWGYGRAKPLLAKAIYVTDPKATKKQMFRSNEALVIKGFDSPSMDGLAPFTAQLLAEPGGST